LNILTRGKGRKLKCLRQRVAREGGWGSPGDRETEQRRDCASKAQEGRGETFESFGKIKLKRRKRLKKGRKSEVGLYAG